MANFPLHEFGTLSALSSLSSLSSTAAGSLLASVWQGLLLAGCVAACLLMVRGVSAAVRSVVWTAVLLLVALLPAVALWRGAHANTSFAHGPAVHLDARWSLAIVAVWAALSLFRLGQLGLSAWKLHTLRRSAVRVQPGPAMEVLLSTGGRRAELCVSAEVDRPSVAGFFRPRVLLPPDLMGRLPEQELAQIVLHEMEHLRRRDDWTNLLQKLALAVLPLNPVLFWLDRRLCLERELACDDGVLRTTDQRKAYAACLTNLAEQSLMRRGLSLALGAVGNWRPQSEVGRRVMRILRRPEAAMGRTQTRLVTGALLTGALTGAVLLGRSPALVSFVSPAALEQARISLPLPSPAPLLPASGRASAARIIPVAYGRAATHPAVLRTVLHEQPALIRAAAVHKRLAATVPPPRLAHIRYEQALQYAPREVLASWEADAAPAHLLLLQDSQFRYAAVPVRDGWLIIQL